MSLIHRLDIESRTNESKMRESVGSTCYMHSLRKAAVAPGTCKCKLE